MSNKATTSNEADLHKENGFVYVPFLFLFEISCTMYLRVFNYSNSTPIDNSTECHWAILSQL